MLSERDRQALADIEARICADDPELAKAFEGTGRAARRSPRWRYTAAVAVSALLLVCSLLLALPWQALIWACVTGLAVVARQLHAPAAEERPGKEPAG